jgi:uncharacterized protein (DUF3820 family)
MPAKPKRYDDTTPMPFGKYRGEPLSMVPASYLLWWWDETGYSQTTDPLHDYVKLALNDLCAEFPKHRLEHKPVK